MILQNRISDHSISNVNNDLVPHVCWYYCWRKTGWVVFQHDHDGVIYKWSDFNEFLFFIDIFSLWINEIILLHFYIFYILLIYCAFRMKSRYYWAATYLFFSVFFWIVAGSYIAFCYLVRVSFQTKTTTTKLLYKYLYLFFFFRSISQV